MNSSGIKILIGVVFFNESQQIASLLVQFEHLKLKFSHKVLFVDDGSTDGTRQIVENFLKRSKFKNGLLICNPKNMGVGAAIRRVINYGLVNKFDICVILAGNGKDRPQEISRVLVPILRGEYDYVQGSRFLEGGSSKNTPILRTMMIRVYTFAVRILTGVRSTDATNGFRAYKLSLFGDRRINISQNWLDRYELETYLHYKVLTLGYKTVEVPVSKNYLAGVKKYSKIRPITDWWRLARPIFLLKLGLKN